MMILFDTHSHLDQEDFAADREAAIENAARAGVNWMLCVAASAPSSAECLKIAESHPGKIWAAVGVHPNYASEAAEGDWRKIEEFARRESVVALGETGLDRYWNDVPFPLQQDYFARHLRLSRETKLPVIIHCRDAMPDLLPILREAAKESDLCGVVHAFSGDEAEMRECVALGMYVSFAGNVTYKNKKFESLRAAAKVAPSDRLLVETDSPYLTPEPLRGKQKRNEPSCVVHTAQCLADLRGVSLDKLASQTTENACRLFGVS